MRVPTFMIWGIFLSASLCAQKASVIRCTGQVQYFAPSTSKAVRVYPGQSLQIAGRIKCLKGGSAKLLYQGNTFVVTGTRVQAVADVVKAARASNQMSFGGRFWNFITESLDETESTEQLQRHHREYLSKNSAAIKGYASKEFTIVTPLNTAGKLPAGTVSFRWKSVKGEGPYTFHLQSTDGAILLQAQVRDTVFQVDLANLELSTQQEYHWQVMRNKGEDCSGMIPFKLSTQDKLTELRKKQEYQSASPLEQQLMEAYFLEQEKQCYEANEIYLKLRASEPDDQLVSRTYAAFLARMNMLENGLSILPKL